MSQFQPNLVGLVLDGRYEIIRQIGAGGMGTVWEVKDRRLWNSKRAMKISSLLGLNTDDQQEVLRLAEREAAMLSNIRHLGLPVVFDWFTDKKAAYMVLELIDGRNLDEILKVAPQNQLPIDQALHYAKSLCEILVALHSQNPPIVHLDLKPSNVIIANDGTVKLIDFGISRYLRGHRQIGQTQALGSPGFAAPEQYQSGNAATESSDTFALGALLHYLVSGVNPEAHPFQFETLRTLRPDAPELLEQLLLKATDTTITRRFQSANQLLAKIEEVLLRKGPVMTTAKETTPSAPISALVRITKLQFPPSTEDMRAKLQCHLERKELIEAWKILSQAKKDYPFAVRHFNDIGGRINEEKGAFDYAEDFYLRVKESEINLEWYRQILADIDRVHDRAVAQREERKQKNEAEVRERRQKEAKNEVEAREIAKQKTYLYKFTQWIKKISKD